MPKKTSNTPSKPCNTANECVCIIYGGSLMKASTVYLIRVYSKNPVEFVKENLVQWFGNKIGGRFVKCANADDVFERVLELATERECRVEPTGNILKLSVTNGSALLKEVSGSSTAQSIKLTANVIETKAPPKAKKETKKQL